MALKKSTATAAKAPVKRQATVKKTATNTIPKDTLIENTAATILNEIAENQTISLGDLQNLRSKKDLSDLLVSNNSNPKKLVDAIKYEEELEKFKLEIQNPHITWFYDNDRALITINNTNYCLNYIIFR